MPTKIQWSDEVCNPIVGCSRISAGCKNCYAATAATSPRLQQFSQYQKVTNWDGTVEFVESALLKPLSWKKPKKIFVCSMSDLFHENIPDEWRDRIFAVMGTCPQHTFQILTKRPENALRYMSDPATPFRVAKQYDAVFVQQLLSSIEWPLKNCWYGVTVENQAMANKRIPLLLQIPAAMRWLSVEPMLEKIDLREAGMIQRLISDSYEWEDISEEIGWVVVGGESGNGARPCLVEWIHAIALQCKSANVPVFVKQLGNFSVTSRPEDFAKSELITRKHYSHWCFEEATKMGFELEGMHQAKLRDRKGADISEFPLDLQIRNFPK